MFYQDFEIIGNFLYHMVRITTSNYQGLLNQPMSDEPQSPISKSYLTTVIMNPKTDGKLPEPFTSLYKEV